MSKISYALILAAMMCSCTNTNTDGGNNTGAGVAIQPERKLSDRDVAVHEVPLPEIPDSLTKPSQRADYMMLHFWDGMDFGDPEMVSDTLLVEQTFSNFIEILPRTSSEEAIRQAVHRMFEQASVNKQAYGFLVSVADKYLNDQDSPFRNAALYKYFEEASISQQTR